MTMIIDKTDTLSPQQNKTLSNSAIETTHHAENSNEIYNVDSVAINYLITKLSSCKMIPLKEKLKTTYEKRLSKVYRQINLTIEKLDLLCDEVDLLKRTIAHEESTKSKRFRTTYTTH